jgi:hypothetical protein
MSEQALAALDAIAQGSAEGLTPSQKAMRALDERAAGKDFSAPQPNQEPSLTARAWKYAQDYAKRLNASNDNYSRALMDGGNPVMGAAESLLTMGTAAASPITGLIGGAITRGDNETLEQAAERSARASTYQPRSDIGKATLQGISTFASPLTQIAEESGADSALAPLAMESQALHMMDRVPHVPAAAAEEVSSVRLGKSAGASAADVNVRQLSPELRDVVTQAAKQGDLNPESFQRHVEADQLPIPIRLSRGQATQDVRMLSEEQNARAKDPAFAARFNEQNKALIENLDTVRQETSPTVVGNDHIQNGQTLVDAYKSMDEAARADISAKYKALEDANGGTFPVNGKAFVASADAALAKKMKGRYVPEQVKADLEDFRSGGQMTFESFENLRTNLAAEARKAERSGDGNAASAINIVREHLESLPIEGEAAKIKPLADAARQAAKERFDRLRADPAYKAAAEDAVGVGEASPIADNFVERYVVKGKAAHIKKMREHLAGDDMAQETIAAGALNYLKRKAGVDLYTNDGNFSQAGYNKALNELLPKMNDLVPPETAETLQRIGSTARATQAQPRGSYVNNSNTFVAQLGSHAANVLEGVVNVKAGGIPIGSMVRRKLGGRSERKFAEESLKPGAGVSMKDVMTPKAKK